MATIYDLKPRFQALLRPLCRRMAAGGVTANQVTLAAALLSIAGGGWLVLDPGAVAPLLALPAILFVRMALNAIDGMLAREFDQKSRLGAILNELGDVVSDAALYLPLALHPAVPAWPLILVVILGIIVEMAGVVALQAGASRRYDGPFGKSDRAFAFGLLAVLLAGGLDETAWIGGALWMAALLSCWTIVNRSRKALAEAGRPEEPTP